MTDETKTPDQQDKTPDRQEDGDQQTDWEARFKGLQRKYNVLVDEQSALKERVTDMTSLKEQLEKDATKLSTEKDTLAADYDKQLNELNRLLSEKEQSVSKLTSFQQKVEIANEMNHPELVRVIDSIKDSTDPEEIRKYIPSKEEKSKIKNSIPLCSGITFS